MAEHRAAEEPATLTLSVVMPAHNEEQLLEGSVATVVDGLRSRGHRFEVLICENGSADRTWRIAGELARRYPELRCVRLGGADYGAALRAGFLASSGDLVVNFDVDLVDLGFLDAAVRLAQSGSDVVIATKRGPGAEDRRSPGRRAVTGAFSLLLRVAFGLRASDTHGSKLLRRASLAGLVDLSRSGSDIFDTELVLRAERAGLAISEVPVRVVERRPARTPVASRMPRTVTGLAGLWLRLHCHRA